jgi:hypothetical protein
MDFRRTHLLCMGLLMLPIGLTGCGIDVKTPKDLKLNVDLGADALAKQIDRYTRSKNPAEWYRFLKDPELKKHIVERAKELGVQCIVPTRKMVEGEVQGDRFVFVLKQACYAYHEESNSFERAEFEIEGTVDLKTLKHVMEYDSKSEVNYQVVSSDEVARHHQAGRFMVEDEGSEQ